ncbi:hypothetical protein KFE25_012255 [Diacronema lutheri]|uniref:GINS subunit domain-containing protein n=2 Tax=Diacronema lutheri TaxID=2081491 RepID=A0A8J5XGD0_DIALT|nr:hypothetical protein KFE25_012255 [Diacronema lutheri]
MEIDGADPNVNDDVGRLMQAYVNEKCAPHILPYEQQLAGIIVELVGLQEEKMGGELSASDPRRPYYELELERMRWLLRAYLRTRLLKINTHAFTILLSPELKSRLTAAEVEYAEGYVTLVEEHVKASVTGRLKAGDDNCHVLAPSDLALLLPRQHDGVVFCRIDADAGQVDLGLSAGSAELRRGDIVASSFSDVEPLLLSAGADGGPAMATLV